MTAAAGPSSPAPIIVVSGLPRSGTSMLMQMLEAGGVPVLTDAVRPADASNPRGYYELARVKLLRTEVDPSWLAAGCGKAIKVISFLLPYLPDTHSYRVLFMHRALVEIVESQNRMLDRLGEARGDATDAALLASYTAHLAGVRAMIAGRRCFSTLTLDHVDIVTRPEAEARRVARFLGRDLDIDRMAGVVDPALHRNRSG